MENLSENLKRAFSALEFTKVGNLTVLTALLDQQDRIAQTARAHHTEPEQGTGSIGNPGSTL